MSSLEGVVVLFIFDLVWIRSLNGTQMCEGYNSKLLLRQQQTSKCETASTDASTKHSLVQILDNKSFPVEMDSN